ncbi:ATP-binding protein [Candidatus Solincola tengchongensis]|uniref:ATP-binding protein n=1 Tax=Candidatus Solincola tengchongensis TaxID=2900693 RepID=UPI00257A6E2C|nr:ATP-binding protein [Candidatus Solincola tengchongensis]
MKKEDQRAPDGGRENRRPERYLPVLMAAVAAVLAAGMMAVAAAISPPYRYLVGGALGACLVGLCVFLAWDWWRYREQNKQYIEEITDLNLRFGILADAVSAVSSTLDLKELVENILGVMLALTNSSIGVVLVPDEEGKHLQVLSHRGFREEAVQGLKIPVGRGAVGRAFLTGRMAIRDNLPQDPRAAETYSEGRSPRSQVIMPLKAKGQVVGLAVTATCEEHEYKPEEVSLLNSLGHELAVAMINVELYKKSQKTLEWLADTQEYTEHFIQEMLAGVLVVNAEGDVIYFNREASEMLGLQAKEVLGINYRDMVKEREKFRSLSYLQPILRLCMEEGRIFRHHELVIEGPGGRRMTLNFNAFPLHRAKGEMMGAAVVFMDVTEVKEMERRLRQQDHLSILGQMAAKIAHEVKNPLFAIIGLADELEEEEEDPEKKRLLAMIRREAALSNQWISGMLTFSRSSFPAAEGISVRLHEEVPSLIADFLRSSGREDVAVVPELPEGLPPVMLTRDNLRHVLFNLLENAFHAMPEGGTVTVRARDTGNGFVQMTVEDTGCGIPADILPSIFDPFFTTKEGGTGLGLSIVQKILLDSGGAIDVRSRQDGGTVFTLKLPTRGVSNGYQA